MVLSVELEASILAEAASHIIQPGCYEYRYHRLESACIIWICDAAHHILYFR